jgi:acyl dehydratase
MPATTTLTFDSPPSIWGRYPRIVLARKPRQVRDGASVPRIEARLTRLRLDSEHLARYRSLCSHPAGDSLPPAYPHVLAMPLHIAILASDAFPVQVLGLVHVRNRIEQMRSVRVDETGELRATLEGHRDVERGQEFDLLTEVVADGRDTIWRETCTFLARATGRARGEARARRAESAEPPPPVAVRSGSFRAEAGIGRSYGRISGDVNPIHLSDLSARAFGFDRAIAHGMWSLARCAAELGEAAFARPCVLDVHFKLPIFLPAWVMLQSWPLGSGTGFALRDGQGDKPHLSGTLRQTR